MKVREYLQDPGKDGILYEAIIIYGKKIRFGVDLIRLRIGFDEGNV